MLQETLIIDADDTLWENNRYFEEGKARYLALLEGRGHDRSLVSTLLEEVGKAHVARWGYGARCFGRTLREVYGILRSQESEVRSQESEHQDLIKEIEEGVFYHPVVPFPGVQETLEELAARYQLFLLTKGDWEEQSRKVRVSGLREYFDQLCVVPEKNAPTYSRLLLECGFRRDQTWVIGDSIRSDIRPAVDNGLRAVYIPNCRPWSHEVDTLPFSHMVHQVDSFRDVPSVLPHQGGGGARQPLTLLLPRITPHPSPPPLEGGGTRRGGHSKWERG